MGKFYGAFIALLGFIWLIAGAFGWHPSETIQAMAIGLLLVVSGSAYAMGSFSLEH